MRRKTAKAPVFIGDTVKASVEVTELRQKKRRDPQDHDDQPGRSGRRRGCGDRHATETRNKEGVIMIIEPIIQGVVARSTTRRLCRGGAPADRIRRGVPHARPRYRHSTEKGAHPRRFHPALALARRASLAFGDAQADTIAVSFERGANDKGVGTAGWYNIAFNEAAKSAGRIARTSSAMPFPLICARRWPATSKTSSAGRSIS